jgi:hypothetical protein
MWRVAGSSVLALGLLAAVSVSRGEAASRATLVIRPGESIGKFALGMTQHRLVRVAGPPRYVVARGRSGFGQRRVDYQYGFGAEYVVTLVGRPGQMRVTSVSTTLPRERTRRGIGVGSRERALRRAYPRIRCGTLAPPPPPPGIDRQPYVENDRDCTLFSGRGTRTIFRTAIAEGIAITAEQYLRGAIVLEIVVTAR